MRALIVDDSKTVRSILARMLSELEFDVAEAIDGAEAIAKVRQGLAIDLVTLNWVMPHVNGLEFLKTIRADTRFRAVPIVVVSADESQATIDLAMSAGANAFIQKPVSRSALQEGLNRLGLRPNRAVTEAVTKIVDFPRPSLPVNPTSMPTASTPQKPGNPLRVMLVDDSVVVRSVVKAIISSDPNLQVVASVANGRIAMQKLETCDVDIVLLDIEMPVMDGFETLREIRKLYPKLPVIMFSSLTTRGAQATLDALLLGASDYVPKPGDSYMSDTAAGQETIEKLLVPKIKQFGRANAANLLAKPPTVSTSTTSGPSNTSLQRLAKNSSTKPRVVAIGVSTGGPQALAEFLPDLVPKCPVPILIVQHMPATFTGYLADRLRDGCGISIREALHNEPLQPGHVHLAPGGRHMSVASHGSETRIAITDAPPENACRPSVDVLFRSVERMFHGDALAIMLNGMGSDGMRGCELLHKAGGQIVVQDEASSVVWGMPGNVYRAGYANKVLPLTEIAGEALMRLRAGVKK